MAPRLQVLSLIPSLVPGGGAEQSLAALAPLLVEQGVDPLIVTLDGGGALESELGDTGVPVRSLLGDRFTDRVRGLRTLVDEARPDVVHTSLFDADVLARVALRSRRVPIVTTWASTSYAPERRLEDGPPQWKRNIVQIIDAATGRWADVRYHAVTAGVAEACCRDLHVAPHRVRVVERGRDLARFRYPPPAADRTEARRRLGVPDDAIAVVNVARQSHQKGHLVLLDAWERFAAAYPTARLVLIGPDGPSSGQVRAALDELAHRSPDAAQRLLPLGERTDVPELLPGADVFVSASTTEGAAGAVLEAMAAGVPVVSTDVAGLAGVIDDAHALRPTPGDPDALLGALRRAVGDPAGAADRVSAARRLIEERFTIERSAARMAEMYRWAADAEVVDR